MRLSLVRMRMTVGLRTEVVQAGPRLESSQSTLRVRTTSPAGVSRPRHVVTL